MPYIEPTLSSHWMSLLHRTRTWPARMWKRKNKKSLGKLSLRHGGVDVSTKRPNHFSRLSSIYLWEYKLIVCLISKQGNYLIMNLLIYEYKQYSCYSLSALTTKVSSSSHFGAVPVCLKVYVIGRPKVYEDQKVPRRDYVKLEDFISVQSYFTNDYTFQLFFLRQSLCLDKNRWCRKSLRLAKVSKNFVTANERLSCKLINSKWNL